MEEVEIILSSKRKIKVVSKEDTKSLKESKKILGTAQISLCGR